LYFFEQFNCCTSSASARQTGQRSCSKSSRTPSLTTYPPALDGLVGRPRIFFFWLKKKTKIITTGLTYKADKCVNIKDYVTTLPKDEPIVFVCGAFAHGQADLSICDEEIAISEYPLSGSVVCGKVCCAFEDLWGIL